MYQDTQFPEAVKSIKHYSFLNFLSLLNKLKHLICITILSASPKPRSDFLNSLRFFSNQIVKTGHDVGHPRIYKQAPQLLCILQILQTEPDFCPLFSKSTFWTRCFRSQSAPCANLSEWQASTLSFACLFHALYQASDGSLSHHMWNASWHRTCLVGHLDTAERTFVTVALASPKLSILFELLRWNCLLWHPDGFEAFVSRFAFFCRPAVDCIFLNPCQPQ